MELFKIFGTVGLKGVKESEKELNNLTDNAQKSSSKLSKLGKVASSVGKASLVAVGAIATGSIALVKNVSSSYGALQQSIGGIETLFGESAQKVIDNANKAYTTAGISANEYMQQVTSFSASLLQALGGDTEKACDSADMAIRDMADNANKMGTSMEMIQNAYQGFAKQNFTMLDNLKLGYGGTKTEMERLLADAQKISGIKYDISNLDDVYQAIHVIQQEMGITGTTAKEAGETIEGSFNSLGASWQNFIAGLGDPNADMQQLVGNLAKSLNGAINNVVPIINNMVKILPTVADELINMLGSILPTLIETFTDLLTNALNAVIKLLPTITPLLVDCILKLINDVLDALPSILDVIMQLIFEVAKALTEALPTLYPAIISIVASMVNMILDNLDKLIEIGTQLILAIVQGIMTALPTLIEMLPSIVAKIVKTLLDNLPLLIDCAIAIIEALTEGLLYASNDLTLAVPELIFKIVASIISSLPKIFEAGVSIVNSLLNGIKISFGGVIDLFTKGIDKIKEMWTKFTNWLKNGFKLPKFTFSGSTNPVDWIKHGLPKIGVEWYADGGIMTQPTLFGYNQVTGNAMVGGEAGAEAILPIDRLQTYVTNAVKQETSDLSYGINKLIEMLSTYLPDIKDAMGRPIVLDSGKVVGGIANKMDNKLGDIMTTKARFGV